MVRVLAAHTLRPVHMDSFAIGTILWLSGSDKSWCEPSTKKAKNRLCCEMRDTDKPRTRSSLSLIAPTARASATRLGEREPHLFYQAISAAWNETSPGIDLKKTVDLAETTPVLSFTHAFHCCLVSSFLPVKISDTTTATTGAPR